MIGGTEDLTPSDVVMVDRTQLSPPGTHSSPLSASQELPLMSPGTQLDKYDIVRTIAAGGMGVVYHARHRATGQDVALKVLLPSLALSTKVQARFQQEAQLQSRLRHDHIVRVHDFVVERGTLAMVMQLVDGVSLEDMLESQDGQAWPLASVRQLIEPVLSALGHAHEHGVVHRDFKPGNILLELRHAAPDLPSARISDFGLAKLIDAEMGLTQTGSRLGTIPYMAPEQFEGRTKIDARADVFAAGILMWRLLAGRLPVDTKSPRDVLATYTSQLPIPSLADAGVAVPAAIGRAVDRALSIDPDRRFVDANELMLSMVSWDV